MGTNRRIASLPPFQSPIPNHNKRISADKPLAVLLNALPPNGPQIWEEISHESSSIANANGGT